MPSFQIIALGEITLLMQKYYFMPGNLFVRLYSYIQMKKHREFECLNVF